MIKHVKYDSILIEKHKSRYVNKTIFHFFLKVLSTNYIVVVFFVIIWFIFYLIWSIFKEIYKFYKTSHHLYALLGTLEDALNEVKYVSDKEREQNRIPNQPAKVN